MNRFRLFTDAELEVFKSSFDRFAVVDRIALSREPETSLYHEFAGEYGQRLDTKTVRAQRERIVRERDAYKAAYHEIRIHPGNHVIVADKLREAGIT